MPSRTSVCPSSLLESDVDGLWLLETVMLMKMYLYALEE